MPENATLELDVEDVTQLSWEELANTINDGPESVSPCASSQNATWECLVCGRCY